MNEINTTSIDRNSANAKNANTAWQMMYIFDLNERTWGLSISQLELESELQKSMEFVCYITSTWIKVVSPFLIG